MSTGVSVAEIHRYPTRPVGFEEPLFLTPGAKKEIAEHLAASAWLCRAAEAPRDALERPCYVFRREDGTVCLVWREAGGRCRLKPRFSKRRIQRVLERWREVRGWWEPGEAGEAGGRDRLCFRVLVSGGRILDLALERNAGRGGGPREPRWLVVGIVD